VDSGGIATEMGEESCIRAGGAKGANQLERRGPVEWGYDHIFAHNIYCRASRTGDAIGVMY